MLIKMSKAIELIDILLVDRVSDLFNDEQNAVRLGLVGLKAILFYRNGGRWDFKALLEGEQPEEIVK